MKRKTIILIVLISAILLGVFLFSTSLSKYNQVVFLMRHISLYLLLSTIILTMILVLYKKFKQYFEDKQKHTLYQVFTVIVFVGLLFAASLIQLNYIEAYESPLLVQCSYYDEYGNLLYYNHLPMSCDEPTRLVEGNTTTMVFAESYEGPFRQYWMYDPTTGDNLTFWDGDIIIDLVVQIDTTHENNKLTHYTLSMTETAKITVDGVTEYATIVRQKTVDNTYQSGHLTSTQHTYVQKHLDQSTYNSVQNQIQDISDIVPVSSEEISFVTFRPYDSQEVNIEFVIKKKDLLEDPDEVSTIMLGTKTITNDENIIFLSKTEQHEWDLSTIRYTYTESESQFEIGPTLATSGVVSSSFDIVRTYGSINNNLLLQSLSTTNAGEYDIYIYDTYGENSVSIEIPQQVTYAKVFTTAFGYRVESFLDGEYKDYFLENYVQDFYSDMSYYSYDYDIRFLDYEEIMFVGWPDHYIFDPYRAIFDFD